MTLPGPRRPLVLPSRATPDRGSPRGPRVARLLRLRAAIALETIVEWLAGARTAPGVADLRALADDALAARRGSVDPGDRPLRSRLPGSPGGRLPIRLPCCGRSDPIDALRRPDGRNRRIARLVALRARRRRAAGRRPRPAGVTVVSGMARGCDAAAHARRTRGRRTHGGGARVGRRRGLSRRSMRRCTAASPTPGAVVSEWAPGNAAGRPSFPAAEPHHQRPVPRDRRGRGVRQERVAHHRRLRARAGARRHGRARDRSSASATAGRTRCCATAPAWWSRPTTCSRSSGGRGPDGRSGDRGPDCPIRSSSTCPPGTTATSTAWPPVRARRRPLFLAD